MLLLLLLTAPAWLGLLWLLWEELILPRMVPRARIEQLAEEALARHGEVAADVLWLQEDHARRYSHSFEAGLLRRVQREIRRRLRAAMPPTPPPAAWL
jgi:hypothetical protein